MNKALLITIAITLAGGMALAVLKERDVRNQRRGHPAFIGKQFGYILQDRRDTPKQTEMIYLDDMGQWHQQWFPSELVVDISEIDRRPAVSIDSLKRQFK